LNPASFKDHFSKVARAYAAVRPQYPDELYAFLASHAPARDFAWDAATGNGQAAIGLARHIHHVIATDASAEQIAHAIADARVEYRIARAEQSGLSDASIDVITVAQAAHWFDLDAFYDEVRRVARPDALIALWSYGYFVMTPSSIASPKASCKAIGRRRAASFAIIIVHSYFPSPNSTRPVSTCSIRSRSSNSSNTSEAGRACNATSTRRAKIQFQS
jgi:ubiquinone/menaquinone biosynthesis C-methylase UbiE